MFARSGSTYSVRTTTGERKTSRIVPLSLQKKIGFLVDPNNKEVKVSHTNGSYFTITIRGKRISLVRTQFTLDMLTLTAVVTQVWLAPMYISWEFQERMKPYFPFQVASIIAWCLLVIDLLANFIVPFHTKVFDPQLDAYISVNIEDPHIVAVNYARSWFILDVISLSNGISILSNTTNYYVNTVTTVLSLLCLFRVPRVQSRFSYECQDLHFGPKRQRPEYKNMKRILEAIGIFTIVAHYLACGFFAIGWNELQQEQLNATAWIATDQARANTFTLQYVNSLYWAVTTLVTVGYGDIVPKTQLEKVYSIFVLLIGAVMYAAVFGSVTILFQNLDISLNRYNEKMDKTHEFLKHAGVPAYLEQKIIAYSNKQWSISKGFEFDSFLSEFPPPLQVEVKMARLSGLVSKVPMFSNMDINFLKELVVCLKHRICLRYDYIFAMGDIGVEMYFLRTGQLCVIVDNDIVAILSPGSHFGEIGILTRANRTAGVMAEVDSEYYSLHRDDFNKILNLFPQYRQRIVALAEKRLQRDVDREKVNLGDVHEGDETIGDDSESDDSQDKFDSKKWVPLKKNSATRLKETVRKVKNANRVSTYALSRKTTIDVMKDMEKKSSKKKRKMKLKGSKKEANRRSSNLYEYRPPTIRKSRTSSVLLMEQLQGQATDSPELQMKLRQLEERYDVERKSIIEMHRTPVPQPDLGPNYTDPDMFETDESSHTDIENEMRLASVMSGE